MTLTILDFIIIGIIAFSGIVSIFRGFVREILALITWALAIWIAWHFGPICFALLESMIHSTMGRYAVAYGGLFVITMILGALVNYLISQLVDKTGLGATDRSLGLVFGVARGVLIVSVMLLLMIRLTPASKEMWFQHSRLLPLFQPVENWLQGFLPKDQGGGFEMRKETP